MRTNPALLCFVDGIWIDQFRFSDGDELPGEIVCERIEKQKIGPGKLTIGTMVFENTDMIVETKIAETYKVISVETTHGGRVGFYSSSTRFHDCELRTK